VFEIEKKMKMFFELNFFEKCAFAPKSQK